MPKPCCWSGASLLIALGGLGASPLAAAVVDRSIAIEIKADGSVVEHTRVTVRLERAKDLDSWAVYLDEHRTLTSLSAQARRPDGKRETIKRRDQDTVELAGEGSLHSSARFQTVAFPPLPPGSVVEVDYVVRERPYFPGGNVVLGSTESAGALEVSVRGGGPAFRYRVDGALPGLAVREEPGGVVVSAPALPVLSPPQAAPEEASLGAVLRYGWGRGEGWEEVGAWYAELLAAVPRGAEPVRRQARALAAELPGRRDKLAALVELARRRVRYVAVEVGIGGYRPAPPHEVLERQWGDCKDKSLLLIDLLAEVGIEAYPALVLADKSARVDRDFPSPYEFNHLIVAVPADGLELDERAPVAGGYLFLDATQELGGLEWLHPAVQGQAALVVRGGRGELVTTPVRSATEAMHVAVTLTLAASGEAAGEARIELLGELAAAFVAMTAAGSPQESDRGVRELFAAVLPAASTVEVPRWQRLPHDIPQVRLEARIKLAALGGGGAELPLLPTPSLTGLPAPGLAEDRTVPLVAEPSSRRVSWRIDLPRDGCRAGGQDVAASNALGSFRQSLAITGRTLLLERESELSRGRIEPAEFGLFREIALAEHRAAKRRLRVECPSQPEGGTR